MSGAKELAVFAGEVVRLMDKEGHSLQGFFNRVEFVLVDESVVNALDEIDNDINDDSDDTPESINAELEALFDRLFASRTEAEPSLVLGQENSTSEATDDDADEPNGDDSVDPSLRSLLDDFLNDETISE